MFIVFSSLSVGYVDSMGRFITEIESHRKNEKESRLSRAVRRLVNMEQDKVRKYSCFKTLFMCDGFKFVKLQHVGKNGRISALLLLKLYTEKLLI